MRLWSIHPKYLDKAGLIALWREGLLAQKVLEGGTKGYKNHPQLIRFKGVKGSLKLIGSYLSIVYKEAKKRGYHFDKSRIKYFNGRVGKKILITDHQIGYEIKHLKLKLIKRDRERYNKLSKIKKVDIHPLFKLTQGPIELWEKTR